MNHNPKPSPTFIPSENDWGSEPPEIVQQCRQAKHKPEREQIRMSFARITCRKCNYTYTVDSSD